MQLTRTVYISYWVLILVSNIFFVSLNFYLIHKTNQYDERGVLTEDVTLGKLKQKVIQVAMPEYKTTVSNTMDRYIKLTSRENHVQLENSKRGRKVLNDTCVTLAFLNLMLLVPFWRCYISKRTGVPSGKIPAAPALAGAENLRTGGN